MFSLFTGGSAMSSSENTPQFNSKVFISYSSQDKAAADKLREGLRSRHLNMGFFAQALEKVYFRNRPPKWPGEFLRKPMRLNNFSDRMRIES
jgi:hypothetical protein